MEKTESKVLCPVCHCVEETLGEVIPYIECIVIDTITSIIGIDYHIFRFISFILYFHLVEKRFQEAFQLFLELPPPDRPRSTSLGLGFYIEDPSLIVDAKGDLVKKFKTKSLEFYGGVSNY